MVASMRLYAETLTRTPRGATFTSSTSAPSDAIARWTAAFDPGSTRKNTQPPPPAPHTLAALLPASLRARDERSMSSVEIPGAFLRRCAHSSRIRRAVSSQSDFAMAVRSECAISAMRSKFLKTVLSPSMCAFITSQLLMPELRGLPEYASTMRLLNSSRSTGIVLWMDARRR